jgi:uncharacterized membrane protein
MYIDCDIMSLVLCLRSKTMSYQERRALVGLFGAVALNTAYLAYMLPRQPVGDGYSPEAFRFWGSFFLALIGVSILVEIVIAILFAILNAMATRQTGPGITDERDRLIELKARRNAFYIFALGFLLAMIALASGMPPEAMFLLMMLGGLASQIVDHLSQFWFYRWGV